MQQTYFYKNMFAATDIIDQQAGCLNRTTRALIFLPIVFFFLSLSLSRDVERFSFLWSGV